MNNNRIITRGNYEEKEVNQTTSNRHYADMANRKHLMSLSLVNYKM